MGARSRTYGHDHERYVARAYRAKWPDATVRRALQAHSAWEPDVVVEGIPLWTECCAGADVSPLKKLQQAERDVARCYERSEASAFVPVVVWRQKRERTVWATMRLWAVLATGDINEPFFHDSSGSRLDHTVVTVAFEEWLANVVLGCEANAALSPPAGFVDCGDDGVMCPNCVTPWKCNGPHLNVERP